MIFLQAIATCIQCSAKRANCSSPPPLPRPGHSFAEAPLVETSSTEESGEESGEDSGEDSGDSVAEPKPSQEESLLHILESCDYFVKITSIVDIFHIYEPLVILPVGAECCYDF